MKPASERLLDSNPNKKYYMNTSLTKKYYMNTSRGTVVCNLLGLKVLSTNSLKANWGAAK